MVLVARRTLTTAALAAITLGACGDGDGGTGRDRATAPDPEQVADDLSGLELEQAIADRLQDLIREENLPYVTAYDPVFQETTEEDASGTGLPDRDMAADGPSVPVEPNDGHPNEPDLFLRKQLDVYAAAVRPYIDAMDFVVVYSLAWEPFDVSSLSLVIHPEQMRAYLTR